MNKKTFLIALAALTVFTAIAIVTLNGLADFSDAAIADWIQKLEFPALTEFLKIISYMGEWFIYLPVAGLFLAIPKSRLKVGAPAAATLVVSAALNTSLKMIFAVPRPDAHRLITETGFGFPSGHAMNGTAFIGVCTILFLRSSFQKKYKVLVLAVATLFLCLTGFSRIYLGVHNPSDVLAGYAAGLCVCCVSVIRFDKLKNK